MSSASVALEILLKADDQASPVLDKAGGKLKGFGTAAKTAYGIIGGAAGGAAIGMLSDAARAAAADEVSMIALKAAVENTGVAWDDNSAAIEDRIKKGQALAFTDDDVRSSIAQLTTATGDANKALDMQNVVMDIARGRNISLGAATDIAQKAALGQFGALKKIGIVLDEGSTATEALGALQQRYANNATGYGESAEASMFRVKDSIDEWKESIGVATGPAMGFIGMLPGLSSNMMLAGGAVSGLSKLINLTFIPSLIAMAVPFLPIILVVGAIGLAIGLLAYAWSNNWGDIQGKTKGALEFLGGVFDGFKRFLAGFGLAIIGIIKGAIGTVVGILNGLIDGWNAVAARLGLPILGKIEVTTPGLDAAEAALNNAARPRTVVFASVYDQAMAGGGGVPQYAQGTDFVPQTGIALVHRGERIIPAAENRAGGGGSGLTVIVSGPVYGLLDFEEKVRAAIRDTIRQGGYPELARVRSVR